VLKGSPSHEQREKPSAVSIGLRLPEESSIPKEKRAERSGELTRSWKDDLMGRVEILGIPRPDKARNPAEASNRENQLPINSTICGACNEECGAYSSWRAREQLPGKGARADTNMHTGYLRETESARESTRVLRFRKTTKRK